MASLARCHPRKVITELREHSQRVTRDLAALINSFHFRGLCWMEAVWRDRVFTRRDLVSSLALSHVLSSALLALTSGGSQHPRYGEPTRPAGHLDTYIKRAKSLSF